MKKILALLPIIGLALGIIAIATEIKADNSLVPPASLSPHISPSSVTLPLVDSCIQGYLLLLDTENKK